MPCVPVGGRQERPEPDLDFCDLEAEGKSPPSTLFDPAPQEKDCQGRPPAASDLEQGQGAAVLPWGSGMELLRLGKQLSGTVGSGRA